MWYFSGRASSVCITFLVSIVLVRIFSKNDFGIYRQALLIYFLLERILQFGIRHSLFYFLAHDRKKQARYVMNTVVIFVALGLLNLIALWIFKDVVASFLNSPELEPLIPLVGVYVFMMLVAGPFETILIVESKAEGASVVAFLTETIRGVCTIGLVLIFGTLFWGLMGLIAYSSIRCAAYIFYVAKTYGTGLNKDNLITFRKQFVYSAPIGVSGLVGTTSKRLEQFVVSAFFSPSIFATYAIGCTQIPLVNTLFLTVGEVVMPRMVEHLKADEKKDFLALWHRLIIKLSFVGIGSFFLLQVVANDLIILIYTHNFASSVPVFRITLLLILSNMIRYGLVLRSLGYTRDVLIANLIAFVTAATLIYPMVRHFGIIGAAVAAVLVFNANALSQLFFSARRLKIKFVHLFPLALMFRFVCIGGSIFVALYLLQERLPTKVVRIVFSTSLFLAFYILLCYKTNSFNIFQEELIRKLVIKLKAIKF